MQIKFLVWNFSFLSWLNCLCKNKLCDFTLEITSLHITHISSDLTIPDNFFTTVSAHRHGSLGFLGAEAKKSNFIFSLLLFNFNHYFTWLTNVFFSDHSVFQFRIHLKKNTFFFKKYWNVLLPSSSFTICTSKICLQLDLETNKN